ncbi:MAG TPA: phenylalanine--tRNA ligase subunit beta [Dehalococcoidia bacterium]|nr:phenylalanine--tRNA ligase subunit beta [Dehalococcoidia bacterium]
MLVSLKWLSEYVPLNLPPRELAERLSICGVKVERILSPGDEWEGVRVARVLEVAPHPNADRLRLVTVDIASEDRPTVVCGAPNVAVGLKVAYAPVGTRLRDGHTGEWSVLKAAKIRGVDSMGMVCSEKELGLSEAHEGILELPSDAPVGQPLREYYSDTIFEVEVTPNRPDHMSMLGVAWEVAAQTHVKVKEPDRTYAEAGAAAAASRTSVTIEDKDLCARYLAGIVERVKVGPSPEWMQERLTAAGMRPINNIVDITNFVMLETGQPLHAFDYRKLGGGRIVVRRAKAGERIQTIDGVERQLTPDMLVIADANRPVAVAGVMGGGESEVGQGTTTILLESANFDAVSVRRTSGALNLRTEASIRFEKGLHPELAAAAARRAMQLLVAYTGGRAAKGIVDAYPVKRLDTRVVVTRHRIEQVLGVDLNTTQVRSALTELGFGCRWVPPDRYVVRAPYWRTDVTQADDVAEELARVVGYDRLESRSLAGAIPEPYSDPVRELRERLRDAAVAAGLQEVITYPLTSPQTLLRVQPPEALEVHPPLSLQNPLNSEQSVMRTSLRASLLQAVASNLRRERGTVALFEAARAYLTMTNELPQERELIVGAVAGVRQGRWGEPTADSLDFYDAKGLLEETFERAGATVTFAAAEEYALVRGRTASIIAGSERAGVLGQVHPQVAAQFEIDMPVFLFELDVEALLPVVKTQVRHQPMSRFPAVIQDLALLVDESVAAARVTAAIAGSALVTRATLFDVYEGGPLPEGKRSLAYQVHFQALDRTLTDQEVADARRRIIRRLEHEFGAELRGT